jgi:hypothetical protein
MMEEVMIASSSQEVDETQDAMSSSLAPSKRKNRPFRQDSLSLAYEGIVYTERPRSNEPGTPNRFFASSYTVSFASQHEEETSKDAATSSTHCLELTWIQVVHRHVNGLCIVTAGEQHLTNTKGQVTFQVEQASACSNGQRRKQQAKMLKRGVESQRHATNHNNNNHNSHHDSNNNVGMVTPNSILAQLTLENGGTVSLRACVWGTVLEINNNLTPSLLEKDPLLDGYLAIILPTGTFPPPTKLSNHHEHHNGTSTEHVEAASEEKKHPIVADDNVPF